MIILKKFIIEKVRGIMRWYFKNIDWALAREFHPYYDQVSTETKELFDDIYEVGLKKTLTPKSVWRRDRFLNLYYLAQKNGEIEGAIAECGCWKGLSSFVICSAIKVINSDFDGAGFHIFDSFEGLSDPTIEDEEMNITTKGRFVAQIETVRKNLKDFPSIQYHKGWIPQIFKNLSENGYKFVHIDVDLAEPTVKAFEYFWPRMVKGGIIVCDDYGGVIWQGMRKQLDIFCHKNKITPILLSTGQLLLIK